MEDHGAVGSGGRRGTEPPHGGRVLAAARAWPDAPAPWIDLSTGINPHAYEVPSLPPEAWTRLPEPEELAALEQAAATAYGVRPDQVVAAPGTSALLAALPFLFPGPAALVGPTYGEYHAAWPDALVVPAPGDAFRSRPVRLLCQPDNPTGTVHDPAALAAFARDGVLVVDESYADFMPDVSLAPFVRERAGLVVLRSFGKPYGLAGLRLGFALASRELAARIRRALGPWPVSGPALRIGTVALEDSPWRTMAARRRAADRTRLDALLRNAGFALLGGTPLFVLTRHDEGWADRLARRGILVRSWPDRPGVLRWGIPALTAWDRLQAALSPWSSP